MRAAPLLLATALSLCACSEPAVRPAAPLDDGLLAEGFVPDQAALASREPPGPVMLDQTGPPPDYARTISPQALTALDTTSDGGSLMDYLGVSHGGQEPARDGERWLALDSTGGDWVLTPVTVRTSVARDEIVDGDDGPMTGVEVRTQRSTQRHGGWYDPAVLFFRSPRLTAGPVETAFSGLWGMAPDTEATFTLPGRSWELTVAAVEGRPYHAVLLLDGTPVVYLPDRDAGNRTLHWAGDLDRDGALDLVVNASEHYNLSVLQLWLSSAADEGAPLGLAAQHVATGC